MQQATEPVMWENDLRLNGSLANRLRRSGVRVTKQDSNSILLDNVPPRPGFFNKERTKVFIARSHKDQPFLIMVDEDLEYQGTNRGLARAFAQGRCRHGWRTIDLLNETSTPAEIAIRHALRALGFDGPEPELRVVPDASKTETPAKPGLLESLGRRLSLEALQQTVFRNEETKRALAAILQLQPRLPIFAVESGVGKTNLLHAITRRLTERAEAMGMVVVDLCAIMAGALSDAEKENSLDAILTEAVESRNTVVALEHIELALLNLPRGPLLLGHALDRGARLAGTVLPQFISVLQIPPLVRRLEIVQLGDLGEHATVAALLMMREALERHHGIEISESLVEVATRRSSPLPGHLPAKALALLDTSAAWAALAGERELHENRIHLAATRLPSGTANEEKSYGSSHHRF